MTQRRWSGVLLALAVIQAAQLVPTRTLAQAPLPPSFRQPEPLGSPIPRMLPPSPPPVSPVPPQPGPPPTAVTPDRTVPVTGVAIEGVTAFPPNAFQADLQGLTGPHVPLQRIEAARLAILQQYRADGYILVTVSADVDAAGRLRFRVTEGRIAAVKLDGDIGPAATQVLRFLNRLTAEQPVRSATLERFLLLAQDVPGVSLRTVLEPSTDEPGALNLVAQVSRKPVSGLVTFDNRAFEQTGPIEGLGVLDLNSFTEFGEKTELSYYHAFPNTDNFGEVSTEAFIGGSGLKLRLYAGRGLAVPSGNGTSGLQLIDYHDTTTVLGGSLAYPVIRSRQRTLNALVALDLLESQVDINAAGIPAHASDSLRVLRIGADYAASDLWLGAPRPAVDAVTLRLSRGLHALGASPSGDPGGLRANERTDFTRLSGELSRTQTLFSPWNGASLALMALLAGQWSDDVLPPAEQFYLGGPRFTRGYYAGQVLGDKALAATAELQLNTRTDLSALRLSAETASQFYLFYDWGETWRNQPVDTAARIASAGGGARLQATAYSEFDVEAVGRFNRYPNGGQGSVGALNGIGLYWRILFHY
jgi:hemolysin activation/secretion protein